VSLLTVDQLSVRYGEDVAVDGISFSVGKGESVGVVGESGSGKSQTALAVLGLLPGNAKVGGSIRFNDIELLGIGEAALNELRATKIAMVFQDPMLALNPFVSVGAQLSRILVQHRIAGGEDARDRVIDMLERVGLPDASRQHAAYPHELSGGMRQRVMIASALPPDHPRPGCYRRPL
jgi:ABC-type microcin C transport system duplicated ATPase subunit YejF